MPEPASTGSAPTDPRRWRALLVCLIAGFMALLDVTIVNVALPSIQSSLGARAADLQWVVSGYALAFGMVLGVAGRFGDARGRRTAFLIGVAGFTLASIASGLAPSAGLLVAARALQGLAGGVITPQISGLIQQLFRDAERGRAFGLFGAVVSVSTAVGPVVGGLLIQLGGSVHGWRWIFFVNVPIGLLAILLGVRLLPHHPTGAGHRQRLDLIGMVLLGAGVLLVLLPLIEQQRLSGSVRWSLVGAGVAVLVGFWSRERRYAHTGEPTVDFSLFRRRSYALGCLLGLLYFAGFTAVFFVLSLFLQLGLGYSALATGLTLTPFALGSAVAAVVGGRFVIRLGRPLVAIGLGLVMIGLTGVILVITLAPADVVAWGSALPLLIAGAGSGLVISPNITLTLTEVPVHRAGSAGGVLQTGQRVGAAAGIAAVGAVLFTQLAATLSDWSVASRSALLVSLTLVTAALAVALLDIWAAHRGRPDRPRTA